jgi:hypothetical protein
MTTTALTQPEKTSTLSPFARRKPAPQPWPTGPRPVKA